MTRKTMDPDARREEFLDAARVLFDEKGFESTSVDDIVQKIGVAKGLFYYYFKSKDAILSALIDRLLTEMERAVKEVGAKEGLSAMERIEALFDTGEGLRARSKTMVSFFHSPQNRYLHLDIERQGLEYITPVMESIIRQGVEEGIFHTDHPRETAIAFLAATSALGHRNLHTMTEDEIAGLVAVIQDITERLFGAESGTFDLYQRRLATRLQHSAHEDDLTPTGR